MIGMEGNAMIPELASRMIRTATNAMIGILAKKLPENPYYEAGDRQYGNLNHRV